MGKFDEQLCATWVSVITLSELRYFATPAAGSDRSSGDTGRHKLSGLALTDGGKLNVHMDGSQWTAPVLTSCPVPVYIRG